MNRHLNDPDWLRSVYPDNSLQSIAKRLGVSRNTVRNRLIMFGIERAPKWRGFLGGKSPEHRQKISEATKHRWKENPPTNEFKIKISLTKTKHGIRVGRPTTYVPGRGRVFDYILVAEKMIGRSLKANEVVHHIDDNPFNNLSQNLRVLTKSQHSKLHNLSRARDKNGRFAK